MPAMRSDPATLTAVLLGPAVVAYLVYVVVGRTAGDAGVLGILVGFDLLWWAVSAVIWPEHWLAVRHPNVAVPLGAHLAVAAAVATGLIVRRGGPRLRATSQPKAWPNRSSRARAAAPLFSPNKDREDFSMPGPGGIQRPHYARQRGLERAELLAAENRMFPPNAGRGPMAELMNAALDSSDQGDHAGAIDRLAGAVSEFDRLDMANNSGYNYNYGLQAGAAIALLRQAEAWRVLDKPDEALRCYSEAYQRFVGAMEEQAGEEDMWARQWAHEAQLRRGDLLSELGRRDEAVHVWRSLLPSGTGFVWPSLLDWADEAADRLRSVI